MFARKRVLEAYQEIAVRLTAENNQLWEKVKGYEPASPDGRASPAPPSCAPAAIADPSAPLRW